MKQKKPAPVRQRPAPGAWLRRNLPALLILAVCVGLFAWLFVTANQGRIFNAQKAEETAYTDADGHTVSVTVETAEVINISRDTLAVDRNNPDGLETGNQLLLVRLTSGTHAGQAVEVQTFVGFYTGERLAVGDPITVLQTETAETGALSLAVKNYDRSRDVYLVLGLFLLVVLIVGGKTGLKSLLGLGFTVVALIWIFCPLWMKGAEPVWLALGLCTLVSVMSFVILGGTSRKILCAILGTLAGMVLAALFAQLAQALCRITSYAMYDAGADFTELVNLQERDYPLHLQGILTAGIIISSLGAVMDVAMSLSSAISELKTVNGGLGVRELWKSGMHIGRDMVGTMSNTLILAFVGSSLVLVIRLWSQGSGYRSLMASKYLSVELISALSSSIGVILAVPLTALIGAVLFGGRPEQK